MKHDINIQQHKYRHCSKTYNKPIARLSREKGSTALQPFIDPARKLGNTVISQLKPPFLPPSGVCGQSPGCKQKHIIASSGDIFLLCLHTVPKQSTIAHLTVQISLGPILFDCRLMFAQHTRSQTCNLLTASNADALNIKLNHPTWVRASNLRKIHSLKLKTLISDHMSNVKCQFI